MQYVVFWIMIKCSRVVSYHIQDTAKGYAYSADSGSDSDSESRNKNEEIIPVNRLTHCLDRPADKGHSLRRLAPTLGIGVGT
jgi:hypothetical protein